MIKYTKGEWRPLYSHVDPTSSKEMWYIEAEEGVASKIYGRANAHLIAVAPDMYEALKLYQSHQQGTRGHYCWQCAEAISKAIAKAEAN